MRGARVRSPFRLLLLTCTVLLLAVEPVNAYLGPGAGLEFAGYFMALLATLGIAMFSILMYPICVVIRFFRGSREESKREMPPASPTPSDTPATQS